MAAAANSPGFPLAALLWRANGASATRRRHSAGFGASATCLPRVPKGAPPEWSLNLAQLPATLPGRQSDHRGGHQMMAAFSIPNLTTLNSPSSEGAGSSRLFLLRGCSQQPAHSKRLSHRSSLSVLSMPFLRELCVESSALRVDRLQPRHRPPISAYTSHYDTFALTVP